mgnify:CR=1 FL=1
MSGKAFDAKSNTVWRCDEDGCDIVFVVLDGYVDLRVERRQPVMMYGKKTHVNKLIDMVFRNYLDLSTCKLGQFSKDSRMNKTAKRLA